MPRDINNYAAAPVRTFEQYIAETAPVAEYRPVQLVDWSTAFNRPPIDAVVEGLIFPGRWTAFVAPAKQGKSTFALHIAHRLACGLDPFDPNVAGDRLGVLYLDGEMGELDVIERLSALELLPSELTHLHYTDMPPKGDTVPGGASIVSTAMQLGVRVVVLDGMNAFVSGAEKDDTPWRNLYEQTIAPLERAGIAVLSTDNTGKDINLSARGSSVKLDKADAVIALKRTDGGINLQCPYPRSASYLRNVDLAITGLGGDEPISYRHTTTSWAAGTMHAAALLDRLGIPVTDGREKARVALKAAGEHLRNDVLASAIRYRKAVPGQLLAPSVGQHAGTGEQK